MSRSLDLERFLHWKTTATPGQRHEYYRGYLGEVVGERGDLADEVRMIKRAVADAYLTGNYDLVQHRHGLRDYSYFVIRRATKDPMKRVWCMDAREVEREARRGVYNPNMARHRKADAA